VRTPARAVDLSRAADCELHRTRPGTIVSRRAADDRMAIILTPLQQQAGELRVRLIHEAFRFARAVSAVAGVQRISLLGSVLTSRQDPKDVDLLVRIADDADLTQLAACARRLKGQTQAFNRGADVFLADQAGRYLGRTCHWKVCRPGVRVACDALHCGARPYLHDDLGTIELPATLVARPPLDLWPAVTSRCELPADVAQLLADFSAES
jgi:predicted nucleotidyltransferase